ncbi:hypothetical protein BH09BAC2_BH09BAC2_00260 [soil metagenome]
MKLITELEQQIEYCEIKNSKASAGSVGWHIEHCLLVINQVVAAIEKSDPKDYKPKTTFFKLLIFTLNKIPKGKVKAPKRVQPADELISSDQLKNHLHETNLNLNKLNLLTNDQFFDHPFFGNLNLPATRKFLKIHTNHHLQIIKDIRRSA